jgi:predicted Zn-dependent protease
MKRPNLSKQNGNAAMIVMFLIAIVLIGWGLWAAIGWTANIAAESFPDDWERSIFTGMGDKQGWKRNPTTPDEKRAMKIFNQLKKTGGSRKLDYRLYFVKDKTPNAFAMPGGSIAVTQGLLTMVKSKIGLANVIGHEFGHVQKRHSLASMGHTLILGGALWMVLGADFGILGEAGLSMARSAHSRGQESEADEFGLHLVYKTYGTTKGATEFFSKLASDPKYKGDRLTAMLSTHPYTPDRLENLKKLSKKLESK